MFPFVQGPGLFEPIHGSAPDIAGQVDYLFQSHLLRFFFFLLLSSIKEKIRVHLMWNVMTNMQDKANPLATILSAAMLLKYGLGEENAAKRIEKAVLDTLDKGLRTGDIYSAGTVKYFISMTCILNFFILFSFLLIHSISRINELRIENLKVIA